MFAGKNACPPEQIRGVEDFLEVRDLFKIPLYELVTILKVQDYFGYNWHPDVFKKSKINKRQLALKTFHIFSYNSSSQSTISGVF